MGGRRHGLMLSVLMTAAFAAQAAPRITAVVPEAEEDVLVCRLATEDLPGERIVSTLHSGLVSAVELKLEVLQDGGRPVASNRLLMRLSFDLWEEVYAVDVAGHEARLSDLEGLKTYLGALPPLPVAALSALDAATPAVVRAGLRLHPIAPDTRGRMERMISGGLSAQVGRGDDAQEVSVSLGRLIRFFYGGDDDADMDVSRTSSPFRPGELNHAPH